MLLFLVSSLLACGSSSPLTEDLCYGSSYSLPSQFTPPAYNRTVTYTPKVGQPKTVVSNEKSLDQRFQVSPNVIEMIDLTEQDNEAVLSTEAPVNSVKLMIKNCGTVLKKLYGSSVIWKIPDGAEYLEFSKYSGSGDPALPTVLWNRSDSNVNGSNYEIKSLTQQESGYYKFIGPQHRLLKWEQVLVQEHVKNHTFNKGNYIVIEWPVGLIPSQVQFTRSGSDKYTVLESSGRVEITDKFLSIDDSTFDDSGMYDFVDNKGNLILRAVITIKEEEEPAAHWYMYVAISVFFVAFAGLFGRYLWKRHQEKKRAAAQDEPVPPAVNYLKVSKSNTESDPTSV